MIDPFRNYDALGHFVPCSACGARVDYFVDHCDDIDGPAAYPQNGAVEVDDDVFCFDCASIEA